MGDPPIETEETIAELQTHLLSEKETQEGGQEKEGDQSNEVEGYDRQLEKNSWTVGKFTPISGFLPVFSFEHLPLLGCT